MTGKLANFFNLHDRGEIRVGKRADIAVFDLDEVEYRKMEKRFDVPDGKGGTTWRFTRPAGADAPHAGQWRVHLRRQAVHRRDAGRVPQPRARLKRALGRSRASSPAGRRKVRQPVAQAAAIAFHLDIS